MLPQRFGHIDILKSKGLADKFFLGCENLSWPLNLPVIPRKVTTLLREFAMAQSRGMASTASAWKQRAASPTKMRPFSDLLPWYAQIIAEKVQLE